MQRSLTISLFSFFVLTSSMVLAQETETSKLIFKTMDDGGGGLTLYQEIPASRTDDTVKLQEFKYNDGERIRLRQHTIQLKRWLNPDIFQSATIRKTESGAIQLERRPGQWQSIEAHPVAPPVCPPEEDQDNAIEGAVEIVEAAEEQQEASEQPAKQVLIEQMSSDIEWMRDLDLDGNYQLRAHYREVARLWPQRKQKKDEYRRAFSTYRTAQAAAKEKLFEEMLAAERFQGEDGKDRASRFLTALTIYGEFRGSSTRRPAYYYWAMSSLQNRVTRDFRVSPVRQDRGNQRRLMEHLAGHRGAPAISYKQYSTWNSSEMNNLRELLLQPQTTGDKEARQEIIEFVAEYELGEWSHGHAMNTRLTHYYSPSSMPRVREGSAQREIPDWYIPIRGSHAGGAVRNSVTGETDEAVETRRMTVGGAR